MQMIYGAIFILLSSQLSMANDCEAVKWPYAHKIADLEARQVDKIPRRSLYKYLYFEISSPLEVRIPGLATKLFFILKNTEVNEDKFQMLEGLEWAADLDQEKPRVISIAEICSIEDRISRTPNSTGKTTLKNSKKNSSKSKESTTPNAN